MNKNEAIKIIRSNFPTGRKMLCEALEILIPELKESEDERIRKALIEHIDCKNKELHIDSNNSVTVADAIAWLEKQGEQKPTDKVEPKFKVGDWVVFDNKISCHVDNIYQGKESLMYTITDVNNMTRSYSVKGFDNNTHLWTIQDAKNGDVLTTKGAVFIFKHMDVAGLSLCKSYCDVIDNSGLGLGFDFPIQTVHPATKEQRDKLEKAITAAGYEWNAEKKELKKIEQKSKFYDSMDDLIADALIEEIENSDLDDSSKHNRILWIKSHRQKPAWSEKDEGMCIFTIKILNDIHYKDNANWLKSLKQRMKGE